jgi:hypothetical protein
MSAYCQTDSKRHVERYKAILMTKGYSQTYDVEYDETFILVAKMGTVKILVSCTTNFN